MAKRLSKPVNSVGYRLDWDQEKAQAMDMAAGFVGLSVASFARLALELLVENRAVTLDEVRAEAQRLTISESDSNPAGERPAGKWK